MTRCVGCRIVGKVQGVWFRGSAQREAVSLQITGYARNLPDGSVEVLACGDDSALAKLTAWLWQGPSAARVDDVTCEPVQMTPPLSFTTD